MNRVLLTSLMLLVVPELAYGQVASAEQDFPALETGSSSEASATQASQARTKFAEDESIYVVQERAYSKKKKFELTPLFFTAVNPKFVGYVGLSLSAAYHLRENFSLELMTSLPYAVFPFYSPIVYDVFYYEDLTPERVDLKQMTYFTGLSAQFSAFYGKFEFYGVLLDYDLYATAGFGITLTQTPCTAKIGSANSSTDAGAGECDVTDQEREQLGFGLKTPDELGDYMKLSGHLGGGLRMFFTENLGLRFEVRNIVYSDRANYQGSVTTDIRNIMLLFVGATVIL